MLGYLFLFYGRMGRLQYALWAWIFVPLIFSLVIVVEGFILAFGFNLHADDLKTAMFALVALPIFLLMWMELSLQAVRIRDIGWRPSRVVPAIVVFSLVSSAVAWAVPALGGDTGLITIAASVINLLCTLVLLFTPTDGQEMVPFIIPGLSLPGVNLGFFRAKRSLPAAEPNPRPPAPASPRPAYPRDKVTFGRRGLT
jgi:uncharacterized membrane protein YhaH (DUF805 family)